MNISKLLEKDEFKPAVIKDESREGKSIYCCDLLSLVMGRAPEDSIWITVMSNVNALAVASLADVSCIIFAEGMTLNEDDLSAASNRGINVINTKLDVYSAAILAKETLRL